MSMKSAQEQIKNIFDEINKKKGLKPDPYYSFVRIVEEIGEVARQIFSKKVRPEKYDEENFKEEIVDVIIELLYYSSLHGIEIEKMIFEKLEKIRQNNLNSKPKNSHNSV
ncbi:MAG: MazG nucleotide pyrophosphohydrolase domain-containing protein [Candidatus Doudnabacteria bacterium]